MKYPICIAIAATAMALFVAVNTFGGELDDWGDDEEDRAVKAAAAIDSRPLDVDVPAIDTATIEQAVSVMFDGLTQLQPETPRTQWLFFTAPWCGKCKAAIADFTPWLEASGWKIGETDAGHVQIVDSAARPDLVTQYAVELFPTAILLTDGNVALRVTGYPGKQYMAETWNYKNTALKRDHPVAERPVGMTLGTIKARPQIAGLISALKPFLDGGKLRTEYLSPPGVIKQWLVMQQGGSGIKWPPKAMCVISIEGDTLTITFEGQAPQLMAAGSTRGIEAIVMSPQKISLKLPWMIDPEWRVE